MELPVMFPPLGDGNEKRLVLEHMQGPMAGLYQIVGTIRGDIPQQIQGPFTVAGNPNPIEFASLIKVKERWVLYREVMERFAGRLGDYMPGNRPGEWDPRQT